MEAVAMSACEFCDKYFSRKSNLKRHIKKNHGIQVGAYKCVECSNGFACLDALRQHHVVQHKFKDEKEILKFTSREEFQLWKQEVEKQAGMQYVANTGVKRLSDGNTKWYYVCHRGGVLRSKGKRQRQLKSQGSVRIGHYCLSSSMDVIEDVSGVICCDYFSSHYGHSFDIAHSLLSSDERAALAAKLAEGVPLQTVLDQIRDSASGEFSRIHLITKLDLQNIMASFRIEHTERLNENDKVNVECWVAERQSKENNPVLLFKQQGITDGANGLNIDYFMIVIMTEPQKELLKKLGVEKICIDSTHGTNIYNFHLTTVVVVDEYGIAFPCAYCISNRIDTSSMTIYFKCMHKVIGTLQCKVFMSDDAPAYYNAWSSVMGDVEKRLLCTWHVDKNWRLNINKLLTGAELKAFVYKCLRMLLEETVTETFQTMLDLFLQELDREDTSAFRQYFVAHYARRPDMWAYCYRIHAGINTNMYLESLHRVIKYCYLEDRVNKRIDRLISALLKLTRDTLFDRLIKLSKGKVTHKTANINSKHKLGMNIPSSHICAVQEGVEWTVKSQSVKNMEYHVHRLGKVSICDGCKLICTSCKTSVHTFVCTCTDHVVHFNMCKHIHSVIAQTTALTEDTACTTDVPSTVNQHLPVDSPQELLQEINVNSSAQPVNQHLPVDSPQELLQEIRNINSSVQQNTSQNVVLQLAESVVGHIKGTELNEEEILTLRGSLTKILNVLKGARQRNENRMNIPHNKHIQKQHRFHSTKRQHVRSANTRLTKPTMLQKEVIKESLLNPSQDIVEIHTGFDHVY